MSGRGGAAASPDVSVLVFAAYAEALGAPEVRVPWREGLTVRDVVSAVREMSGGVRLPDAPLVAVNQRYAAPETSVGPADEVALIPPVAGG